MSSCLRINEGFIHHPVCYITNLRFFSFKWYGKELPSTERHDMMTGGQKDCLPEH